MTGRTPPMLGILNETDGPQADMMVVLWAIRGGWLRAQYVSPKRQAQGFPLLTGYMPREFTPLARFGRTAELDAGGYLLVKSTGESTATYHDGVPRRWQDGPGTVTDIRPQIAAQVIQAVRAMRAATPTPSEPRTT